MKNLLPVFLIFSFSQIFVSCSSYVNLNFVKRSLIKKLPDEKYLQANKQEEKNSTVTEELANSIAQENKPQNNFYANKNEKNFCEDINLTASIKSTLVCPNQKLFKSYLKNKLLLQKSDEIKNENNFIPKEKKILLKQLAPGDEMLLLEVILAIFIPPLAIYLHQTENLTNLFWIDLILCLLSILGVGFTPFFGFWVLAIIFSLLVVFDVLH